MKEVAFTHHRDSSPLPVELLDEAGHRAALTQARRLLGDGPVASRDAVVHGARVRLHTTSAHWRKFWSINWFTPHQWSALTGQAPPDEPQIHLYAVAAAFPEVPQARYSAEHGAAFLFGEVPYGALRALTLQAVARWLAEEEAVHFVPGMCLQEGQRGTWLIPTEPDLDLALSTLLEEERAQLVAFDGMFVRYGLVRMVDGATLLPTSVSDEKGITVSGYRLFSWLEQHGYQEPRADARCLNLEGKEVYCFARDLDLERAPDALAYPLEQGWYLPTRIVAAQPRLVAELWSSPLENVAPLTPERLERFGPWANEALASLLAAGDAPVWTLVEEVGQEQVAGALCRLRAAPHGRFLAAPTRLWPGRVAVRPGRPVWLERVALLGREGVMPLEEGELARRVTNRAPPSYTSEITRVLAGLLTRTL